MDNQRLIIWSFFGFMCILTYQAWTIDSTQNEIVVEQAYEENELSFEASPQLNNNLPKLSQPDRNNVTPVIISDNDFSEIITVKTDVLELKINSKGGTIEGAKLLKYPKSKDQPDDVIELLNTNSKDLGLIQTGLRSLAGAPEPNHLASYSSDSNNYELTHQGELIIPLYWTDGNGIKVEKSFRVSQGSYRVDIEHRLTNDTAQDWSGASYSQITRRVTDKERSMFDVESFSFDGPIIFNGEKIEKLDSSDLNEDGPNQFVSSNGWIGSIQHHFLSAVVPEKENEQRYQVSANKVRVVSNMIGPTEIVYSNQTKTFSTTAYIGPKLQSQLNAIDPKLRLSVDYGILTMLSQPLFWLLNFVHSFVQNWGLAIISVTAIIKLLFYKLTEKSGHSMAKMRAIAPRLKAIQERYKDNKTEQGRATMELYKREKVNPIAGCVPMLIQMPFFLAFYWVLLESVEMRQAPFMFWLTDLSSRDPYFILPLIMGGAMLFQQKLNPPPADPMQAKVMQIMPVMFSAMFAFFPSGLVLYWVTNTLLSILQQWSINKKYSA
jgi:YidC/Oxa1 family membrane protein insertase|tara:strand:+ start:4497 stop:6143 length:1647 start_codon:yes stop_codon:yes gene_type:complete